MAVQNQTGLEKPQGPEQRRVLAMAIRYFLFLLSGAPDKRDGSHEDELDVQRNKLKRWYEEVYHGRVAGPSRAKAKKRAYDAASPKKQVMREPGNAESTERRMA